MNDRPVFVYKECDYMDMEDGSAILRFIRSMNYSLKIPSVVFNQKCIKLKMIGICKNDFGYAGKSTIIMFDESSEVTEIPTSLIKSCRSKFFLPPKVKRVKSEGNRPIQGPVIVCDKSNPFVSVSNKRSLINHHPLEIVFQNSNASRIYVRETVRFIGKAAYQDSEHLTSVTIPASVEEIDEFAFRGCFNLEYVRFKGKSKLKKIGRNVFNYDALQKVELPASVEEIGEHAFSMCSQLSSVSFPANSKLRIIGKFAFYGTSIESIEFPKSIEEIGAGAFKYCMTLLDVIFPKKEGKVKIGESAFDNFTKRPTAIKFSYK